jgi:acetylornithine deacetylase
MSTKTPYETLQAARAARLAEDSIALLRACVAIPSITGHEESVARWSADRVADVVDRVEVDVFAPGRANMWARWGGADDQGTGNGLVLTSHLDVVNIHHWAETWSDDPREDPWGAAEVEGAIWGRGVADCKAGVAAALAAVRQLHRAGLQPAAPLTLVFVADEESGEEGSGVSEGVQRAIEQARSGAHPIAGDLVVYGEPTGLDVISMHMGFFVVDLVIEGVSAYFGTPELGVDALEAAEAILPALRAYNAELSARSAHPEIGTPALLVTSVAAGGTISVPGECTVSMIRKLVPGEDLDSAREEIENVIRSAPVDGRISLTTRYPSRRDHAIGGTPFVLDPSAEVVTRAQAAVKQHRPDAGNPGAIPGWSEAPFYLRDLGIPTVYLGAGSVEHCHTPREHVPTADYLSLVDSYVELIADFCDLVPCPPR